MWRALLKRAHPDQGGSDALFVWVQALFEHVAGDTIEEPPRSTRRDPPRHYPPTDDKDRVPYADAFSRFDGFSTLTLWALEMAEDLEYPYRGLLRLLSDCHEAPPSDTGL